MNISKSSWHYRILNKLGLVNIWTTESLCSYFWKMVFAVVFLPLFGTALVWVALIPFWGPFYDIKLPLIIIVGVPEILGLLYLLRELVADRHDREIDEGTREYIAPKEPSLFRQWLSARHRQVCPLIDFVDEA